MHPELGQRSLLVRGFGLKLLIEAGSYYQKAIYARGGHFVKIDYG